MAKKDVPIALPDQAAQMAQEAAQAIAAELAALLPGFETEIRVSQDVGLALLQARQEVEADKARRDALGQELAECRATKADAQSSIDAIHRSGDRSDVAAGKAGLLMRDVAGLQARESELVRDLEKPALSAVREEQAWSDHLRDAKARAFNALALELEKRLVASARTIVANNTQGVGGVGHRWQIGRDIRAACAAGGLF